MTEYHMHGVNLTGGQIYKIAIAAEKRASTTIRLTSNNLHGSHKLPLTQRQITQITKAQKDYKGVNIALSAKQLENLQKTGVCYHYSLNFH